MVVASGHMIDTPDRQQPRFPPGEEPRVTAEVSRALADWQVDGSTTIVCGGARGADLIVAEQGLGRGARVVLCLAEPPAEYVRGSVALPGSDWVERFGRVRDQAAVQVLPDDRDRGDGVYAATNRWMIEVAAQIADGAALRAVVVWNGAAGDGPGGTRDFVRQLGIADPDDERLVVIDPSPHDRGDRDA